jgi:alginate O-acetyltransferase complex protein AlgI
MFFNSLFFFIFLIIVFILYWFAAKSNLKFQNIILLISSYFFYACWDWRFLFLLVFSTLLDFLSGIIINDSSKTKIKRFWFWLSIVINVGFLFLFKYYNFFIDSLSLGLGLFGLKVSIATLQIILPVGISFYTFHGVSYVIDIYKNKIKPERNFIQYSVFVCFFPLLVAGPIERATHLLPQIIKKREFDYAKIVDGLRQILWGLLKKIVVADNCATHVNRIFEHYQTQSGSTLLLGAVLFAFQIYGDFSGYSDIALGSARLFGIELLRNFNYPYFSRNIAEFWRRWHISLTSWFRDYIYIPLGGSRGSKLKNISNTILIFLISGFWHGANWTFLGWGVFHAILFIPLLLSNSNRKYTNTVAEGRYFPYLTDVLRMIFTFLLVVIGWVFFRSDNIGMAVDYIQSIFVTSLFSIPIYVVGMSKTFFSILLLTIVEWVQRDKKHGLELSSIDSHLIKWSIYYAIILIIVEFGTDNQTFIYFQF